MCEGRGAKLELVLEALELHLLATAHEQRSVLPESICAGSIDRFREIYQCARADERSFNNPKP